MHQADSGHGTEMHFPVDRLIFEITEGEEVRDKAHLRRIVEEYRRRRLKVALDDIGSGYSGLSLLAALPVDHIKLDIELVRIVPERPTALKIVKSAVALAAVLGQSWYQKVSKRLRNIWRCAAAAFN